MQKPSCEQKAHAEKNNNQVYIPLKRRDCQARSATLLDKSQMGLLLLLESGLDKVKGWTKTQAQNPETAPPSRWVTGSLAFCFDGIFEVYVSCGVFICVYVM